MILRRVTYGLEAVLLATLAFFHLWLYYFCDTVLGSELAGTTLRDALLVSQPAILAIIFIMVAPTGASSIVLVVGSLLAFVLNGCIWFYSLGHWYAGTPAVELYVSLLITIELAVVATLAVAVRMVGVGVYRRDFVLSPYLPVWRFSLLGLFVITALGAVIMRGVVWMMPDKQGIGGSPLSVALFATGVSSALIALFAAWGALSTKGAWLRMAIALALAPLIAQLTPMLCLWEGVYDYFAWWGFTQSMIAMGTFLVLRACGYRLARSVWGVDRRRVIELARIPGVSEAQAVHWSDGAA